MSSTIRILTLILALAVSISGALAEEKKISRKDTPPAVLSAFKASYPNAKIMGASSEVEDSVTYYEITCKEGKVKRDVLYTADGNVVVVETTISKSELPLPVSNAIATVYPNGKIRKAETLVKDGVTSYEVLLKSEKKYYEVVLSAKGTITETEEKGEKLDDDD